MLVPALCDLVPDDVCLIFGQLCVVLEVLDAEDGEAVVDVAGQAAVGEERAHLGTGTLRRGEIPALWPHLEKLWHALKETAALVSFLLAGDLKAPGGKRGRGGEGMGRHPVESPPCSSWVLHHALSIQRRKFTH